jgi:hypothetical protein
MSSAGNIFQFTCPDGNSYFINLNVSFPVRLTASFPHQKWQARRDSNPQPSDLESDALAVRATGLILKNSKLQIPSSKLNFDVWNLGFNILRLCLFMLHMLSAVPAVFLEQEFFSSIFFVLCSRIIFIFTARTL